MTFLCEYYDREILGNPFEYEDHYPDIGNKTKRYTNNNNKLEEVGEIKNNYITIYNKDYDIYFINCKFELENDNNFILNIEKYYIHNMESDKINIILSWYIKCDESKGYKFCCINQINILIIIVDKCNKTYKNCINSPMPMVERRINFIIAKNPILTNSFDRNKNHPLIRKFYHVPFNNI